MLVMIHLIYGLKYNNSDAGNREHKNKILKERDSSKDKEHFGGI